MSTIFRRLLLAFFAVLAVPLTVQAAKPVSQSFEADEVLYLPLHSASDAYILVNNDFYTTEFPAVSTSWSKTGTTLPLESDRVYNIPQEAMTGLRLNGYTYFVLETGPKPVEGDLDIGLDQIEIWRINQTTGAVERTATMDGFKTTDSGGKTYFSVEDLVLFNEELYLLLDTGKLMRSTDGMNWPEVTKEGMTTADNTSYEITTGKDYVYISTYVYSNIISSSLEAIIYRSAAGNSWEAMSGDYQNTGSIQDMTVYHGQVYAIIANESQHILWRSSLDGMTWENIMSTDQSFEGVDHNRKGIYVVKYLSESDQTVILKSKHGKNFHKVYDATGVSVKAENMIKRYVKPLYLVEDKTENTTTLVRVQ